MPDVQVIPPRRTKLSTHSNAPAFLRRVAAYARVSTDKDEQLSSYERQVDYYTDYITSRNDWIFVSVYTDEGITGVNTKRREGFKQMIADALDGKIDLIVTKSVSRFARNTVDSLITIRKLKEKGVECFFEKENIWTFDGKGELLITLMSSLAQEESRSISENVTWGKRKSMADGNISLPWSSFLGYEKGKDGVPKIVPEEAETVRLIFRLFMQGKSYSNIAKQLTERGIPTPMGKPAWALATIRNILQNETYRGSKRMQKTMTVDFLTKAKKVNDGDLPMFYIESSHEAIIPPEEFDAVQAEIVRRRKLGSPVRCHSPFAMKIKCGCCNAYFGSKVWGSNTKYRRIIWRCNDRYNKRGKADCSTSHVKEEDVKRRFLTAFNELMLDRNNLVDDCRLAQRTLCDISAIDAELAELENEIERVDGLTRQAISENARQVVDQTEWVKRNGLYLKRRDKATKRIEELDALKLERVGRSKMLEMFIKKIEKQDDVLTEFDEDLWSASVDYVVVGVDGDLKFVFKNGTEISD